MCLYFVCVSFVEEDKGKEKGNEGRRQFLPYSVALPLLVYFPPPIKDRMISAAGRIDETSPTPVPTKQKKNGSVLLPQ
jgi:hypothetical protein